jgi:hypothetical protein
LEQISKFEKKIKNWNKFWNWIFLENGTNYELEQNSKMKQLSNWMKCQNWNRLRIEMNFEF